MRFNKTISGSTEEAMKWFPEWEKNADESARAISDVHKNGEANPLKK